jgi:hypothetical protein
MAHSKIAPNLVATDVNNRFVSDADKDNWNLKFRTGYNYLINGNFDFWQRADGQTTNGCGSDDRWFNQHTGSSKTVSKQAFTVGELFPDGTPCPKYYSRTVVASVVGATNNTIKQQRIEAVHTLAGKKAVLSFWAKANATKNIAIEFLQYFGAGGTPSSIVYITPQKITLTTVWQKFVIFVDIPAITGKVLGTSNTDILQVNFWFDSGSTFNGRNDSLGHQSGTFDIAQVSLVEGEKDIAPIPRSIGEELELCLRYFEILPLCGVIGYAPANGPYVGNFINFTVKKRVDPVITVGTTFENTNLSASYLNGISANGFRYYGVANAAGQVVLTRPVYIDAEL